LDKPIALTTTSVVTVIVSSYESRDAFFDENEDELPLSLPSDPLNTQKPESLENDDSSDLVVIGEKSMNIHFLHTPMGQEIIPSQIDSKIEIVRTKSLGGNTFETKSDEYHANECEFCHKVFTLRCNYLAHRRQHLGDTVCPYCDKVLSTKGNLKKHMETAHGKS